MAWMLERSHDTIAILQSSVVWLWASSILYRLHWCILINRYKRTQYFLFGFIFSRTEIGNHFRRSISTTIWRTVYFGTKYWKILLNASAVNKKITEATSHQSTMNGLVIPSYFSLSIKISVSDFYMTVANTCDFGGKRNVKQI